ncbi:hypothetical protein HDU98_000381 [Podochytrium sp. JEL0797]|nr:hypothetical protein HDU98_000381 [Podochytrium sp. JEL0797]
MLSSSASRTASSRSLSYFRAQPRTAATASLVTHSAKLKAVAPWMATAQTGSRSARLYQSTMPSLAPSPKEGKSSALPLLACAALVALGVATDVGGVRQVKKKTSSLSTDAALVASAATRLVDDAIAVRCDTSSQKSDTSAQSTVLLPWNRSANIFVVVDEQVDPETAKVLQNHLPAYVADAIFHATNTWYAPVEREAMVSKAIQQGIDRLDQDLMNGAFAGENATGSTRALVAIVDGSDLFVASTGDAKALLASRNQDGTFATTQLSQSSDDAPVFHQIIDSNQDLFLVLATESVAIKNADAVSIVAGFLQQNQIIEAPTNKVWGNDPLALGRWSLRQDSNAASALIRNASRNSSNDTTNANATVVFFGNKEEPVDGVDVARLIETVDATAAEAKLAPVDWAMSKKKATWVGWLMGSKQ